MNGLGDEEAYLRDPNADDRSYYGAVHSAAVIMDNARISATFSRVCLASRSAKFSRRAPAAMANLRSRSLEDRRGFPPHRVDPDVP
jgi:hypothetical protein